ncbi:hypothetical protein KCU59_g80, partial [Aureobasidium melanogenum]
MVQCRRDHHTGPGRLQALLRTLFLVAAHHRYLHHPIPGRRMAETGGRGRCHGHDYTIEYRLGRHGARIESGLVLSVTLHHTKPETTQGHTLHDHY